MDTLATVPVRSSQLDSSHLLQHLVADVPLIKDFNIIEKTLFNIFFGFIAIPIGPIGIKDKITLHYISNTALS